MQTERIILISDLSGAEFTDGEGRTVSFGLDGVTYEMELLTSEVAKLEKVFAPYVEVARRTGGAPRGRRGGARKPTAKRDDLDKIRAWGIENGFKVSGRGRVSRELQDAYDAVH